VTISGISEKNIGNKCAINVAQSVQLQNVTMWKLVFITLSFMYKLRNIIYKRSCSTAWPVVYRDAFFSCIWYCRKNESAIHRCYKWLDWERIPHRCLSTVSWKDILLSLPQQYTIWIAVFGPAIGGSGEFVGAVYTVYNSGLKIRKIFNCTQIERRRRKDREFRGSRRRRCRGGGVWGRGIPLPIRLEGLGERCELPQWGLGRSPSWFRFWCILLLKSGIW